MKKLIITLLLCSTAHVVNAQDFNKSMAEIMKSMKAYTIDMVDRMPEDKFDFRPTDSVRTFRGQIQHMVATHHFLLNYYLKGDEKPSRDEAIQKAITYAEKAGKSELVDILKDQFDEAIAFFEQATAGQFEKSYTFGTPEQPLIKDYFTTSMLIRDHISHHRAQLIAYLRLNNIDPAPYRGF